MLWDVTDKDCDRFGLSTLEKWGLFAKSMVAPQTVPKTPGRKASKTPARKGQKDGVTLDQKGERAISLAAAVGKSRDACYLRYLNGAAPVVYGIPVFLR